MVMVMVMIMRMIEMRRRRGVKKERKKMCVCKKKGGQYAIRTNTILISRSDNPVILSISTFLCRIT